jgi:flagellar biosynthesis protein FlhG
MKKPKISLTDFFEKRTPLADLVVESGIANMGLVSGDLHSLASDSIRYTQKLKLFRHIKKLDADYVLIDLGAGSKFNTLDSFLLADRMIVVIIPDIAAVENLYHFLKNALFRKIKLSLSAHGLKDVIRNSRNNNGKIQVRTMKELIDHLKGVSSQISEILDRELAGFKIHLILNHLRNREDIMIGNSVKSVCMKYFGFRTQYAGYIEYDECIGRCMRRRKPFMQTYPGSRCAKEIRRVAENLLEGKQVWKISN